MIDSFLEMLGFMVLFPFIVGICGVVLALLVKYLICKPLDWLFGGRLI